MTTETFRSFSIYPYSIKLDNLKCRSSNVVYLFSCKACSKQYTGSTESFLSRFNTKKSPHGNFFKGVPSNKFLFRAEFEDDKHHGMNDREYCR